MLIRMGPSMWLAPAVFGLMLIGFGVLLLYRPQILIYLIAGLFIFSGTSVLVFALTARATVNQRGGESGVVYRRIDEE